jgi:hypothetical protein
VKIIHKGRKVQIQAWRCIVKEKFIEAYQFNTVEKYPCPEGYSDCAVFIGVGEGSPDFTRVAPAPDTEIRFKVRWGWSVYATGNGRYSFTVFYVKSKHNIATPHWHFPRVYSSKRLIPFDPHHG